MPWVTQPKIGTPLFIFQYLSAVILRLAGPTAMTFYTSTPIGLVVYPK